MKRYIYLLCLSVSLIGLSSCSKNNDPAPQPVVGRWSSDYLLASGFVAPYAANNGLKLNPLAYGINDTYDIKSDKTFTYTDRSSVTIQSLSGTWDYSGTQLNLKYDDGNSETFNYDASSTTPQLQYPTASIQDTLVNPNTKQKEVVKFNLQLIYSKQ